MEWIEAAPLPKECQNCKEGECYNCDYAGARWYLSPEDEQMIRNKMMQRKENRHRQRPDSQQ